MTALASLSMLEARLRETPAAVSRALEAPRLEALAPLAGLPVLATGAGGSSLAAKLLVSELSRLGLASARYLPPSAFTSPRPERGHLAVIVSQGLSPHARLALDATTEVGDVVLLTSSDELDRVGAEGARPRPKPLRVPLEVEPEEGLLVRVTGPAAAAALALRVARALGRGEPFTSDERGELAAALAGARARAREAAARRPSAVELARADAGLALVTVGEHGERLAPLAWGLMETLLVQAPPCLDALGLAHGALQAVWDRPMVWITLEHRGGALDPEIHRHLEAALGPRHALVRLVSPLPMPLAALDLHHALAWLTLELAWPRAHDLRDWPGKGRDDALFRLGAERGSG
jgi:hypothetical protein